MSGLSRLKNAEAALIEGEQNVQRTEMSYIKDSQTHNQIQREMVRLQETLDKVAYKEGELEDLVRRR